ncbi:Ubiquitin-60S ribosomal protein L40 [Seminavis robusta]|uniref:Ubiquitin-60S ribosomal protein L40 n=1 Tax=Seminavis robusta TaxID=568900 RepID=A0A9N8F0M1_9STRA|nr:Ubiquitin-60S ribosomal protein L40 [Seminavis robusta]CAB9529359.1 Ubiquitin-60S ribosomal protein L40 [Seminavis robusta]|eukprot:Sro191_g082180.1 Ubiquitin-60S ribosomal protein L40 (97) ;mRNA; r:35675-35965
MDTSSLHHPRIRSGSICDHDSQSMTIFVVDKRSSSHLLFGVGHTDTVHSLKSKIADRRGIPFEQQRLVFGGQQLQDDAKLSDYKIRAQSCIHLDGM